MPVVCACRHGIIRIRAQEHASGGRAYVHEGFHFMMATPNVGVEVWGHTRTCGVCGELAQSPMGQAPELGGRVGEGPVVPETRRRLWRL